MHVQARFSYYARYRRGAASGYGVVWGTEIVEVEELAHEYVPLAGEGDVDGTYRAYRLADGVLYERADGVHATIEAALALSPDDGVAEGMPDIVVDSGAAPARADALAEVRRRYVLVDGEPWIRVTWEPVLKVDLDQPDAATMGSSRDSRLGEVRFSPGAADFAASLIERTMGRRPNFRIGFRVYDPAAFGHPCETNALLHDGGLCLLEEMKSKLSERSEAHLVAYARLRDACISSSRQAIVGEGSGRDVRRRITEALEAFQPTRRTMVRLAGATARWDAFEEWRAERAAAVEAEAEADGLSLAGMAP